MAILIYSRSSCPYCEHAKRLLLAKGAVFEEIRVDQVEGALDEMMKVSQGRTFPQIIIHGKAIGGYDDLKALQDSGELDALLA